ncbi:glycosyltransferase [Luteolibacter flavescens]|uniref:Glycosyltransferase n=1 Tax=Luteolibacter flavescens TaxID=1859460 RepID=A0ABT3FQN8_9BACT|nr:glycosyltransferase [Luteolibacter flavescens]MCW1885901.1 glycosyltransferase [Luteolibacter flavescens]
MSPAISIVLPFRNAAPTIEEAVESLRNQTFENWELIAVDDHSSDCSAEIVAGLSRLDGRIKLISNKRSSGVVGAFQSGFSIASSVWIARMDADDRSHPKRLQLQWGRAMVGDVDVITTNVSIVGSLGNGMARYVDWANRLLDHDAVSINRFVENPVINPTVLVRRNSFEAVGGYQDVPWAEDHDVWLRMLHRGARFAKVPEVLLDWRDSTSRLTRSDSRYGEKARQQMRAFHLAALDEVRERGVVIAGAGPIGKSLARELLALGVRLHGFIDVHPRRIGEVIHGAEVAGLEDLGRRWRDAVLLSAVGLAGVREEIRGLAIGAGYVESLDFWCVC